MKRRKMMMAAMVAGMALAVTACGGSKKITEEDLATMSADEFEKAFSDAAEKYDASVAAEKEKEEKEAEASGELKHYEALPEIVSAEFEDGKKQLLDMVFQMPGTVADLVEAVENSEEDLTLMTGKREPESPYNPQLMVSDELNLYIMNNGAVIAYAAIPDLTNGNESVLLEDCCYINLPVEDEYLEYAYLAGGLRCDGDGLTYNDIQERYGDRELKASSSTPSNLYFSLPTYNITELDGFFSMFEPKATVSFATDPTTFQATGISQRINSYTYRNGIHRADPTDEILSSSLGYGSVQLGNMVIDLGMTTGELFDLVENSEENISADVVTNPETVDPHDTEWITIDKGTSRIASLHCYNPTDAPMAVEDCPIINISFGEYCGKYRYYPTGILREDIKTVDDYRAIFANDTANTWTESQDTRYGSDYIIFTANEPVSKTFGTIGDTPCTIYMEAGVNDEDQTMIDSLEYGIQIPE